MADTVASVPPLAAALLAGASAPPPPVVELVQQPPAALLLASTLAAVVVGRGGNGALLLRTDYGTLALRTTLDLAAGSHVDLKLQPGPPATVVLLNIEAPPAAASAGGTAPPAPAQAAPAPAGQPGSATTATPAPAAASADEAPPAQLSLGSEIEATIIAAPAGTPANAGLAVGTRLTLRVALPEPDALPPTPQGPQPVSFAGSVAAPGGEGGDKTTLETTLGRLLLDQRLALPPGTTLSLTRLATLSPTTVAPGLDMGMVVQAKVLSPAAGNPPNALPAGSALTLRIALAGAAAAAAGSVTGTIAATSSSETVIETPLGTLSLDRRLALPAGTPLALEPLAAAPPDQPSELPLAQRAGWPSLDQALSVLDRVAPELAARLRTDLAPSSGQQLAGTLLFLMSALNTGSWPGARALSALDAAGRRDLRTKLEGDSAELRQLADPKSGDWRLFVLPTLDGGVVNPVRLYLRRRAPSAATADQGTRFVLDVDMSRLGAVQLDGLVRNQRFDLVLRSHRAITAEMRQGIADVFHNAVSAAGLGGDITFTTASRFAVTPLDAVQSHIGISA